MKKSELKYKDGEVVYNIKENRFFTVRVISIGIQGNEDYYGLFEFKKETFNYTSISGFNVETNYNPIKYDDVISKHEYRQRIIKDLL